MPGEGKLKSYARSGLRVSEYPTLSSLLQEGVVEENGLVITGELYSRIMWPLNDVFRARMPEIGALPYEEKFESEADNAIMRMPDDPKDAWSNLSPGAWRVLLERHTQMLVVATLNEAAGNPLMQFPPGVALSEEDMRVALALFWLLEMKLPFPVDDRSHYEFPQRPEAKGH